MFSPEDDKEQFSASEILNILKATDTCYIGDKLYDLSEITDLIDNELMREVMQTQLVHGVSRINELYINEIVRLME